MKKEEINHRFEGEVTYFQVLLNDIISFLMGLFYLLYIAILLLILISVFGFGADAPSESAIELILGFVIITGIFIIGLKFRISSITQLLRNGEDVNAEVLKGLAYEFFVHINIHYQVEGKLIKKKIMLPNTKRPRELIKEEKLLLSKERNKKKKVIVRTLYMKSMSQTEQHKSN